MLRYLLLVAMLLLVGCETIAPQTTVATPSPDATRAVTRPATDTPPALITESSAPSPTPESPTNTPARTATAAPTPITPGDEVRFEPAAQLGGSISSVALAGETLFAGQGPRLVALNVSDPVRPRLVGQSEVLPGLVDTVIVSGERAIVTAGGHLLRLNVGNPENMVVQAQMDLPAPTAMILLRDDVLYAGGHSGVTFDEAGEQQPIRSTVATVDLSGTPRLLDTITFPAQVTALALADDTLYVGQRGPGPVLLRLDVTDPAHIGDPIQIGGVPDAFSLRVAGETLFVGGFYRLTAFDISNPNRPAYLWREEGPHVARVFDLAVAGGRLYTMGLQAAGATIPAHAAIDLPESLPEPSYKASAQIVAGAGHLYIAEETLKVFAPAGSEPALLGQYVPPTGGALALSEDMLYVGNGTNGLAAYQLPDLAQTAVSPPDLTAAGTPRDIYTLDLVDNQLYLTGDNELRIFDAGSLTLLGEVYMPDPSLLFQQAGRRVSVPVIDQVTYVHASSGEGEQLIRFDVSDPTRPTQLDVIPFERDLRVADSAATQQWLVVSLYDTGGDEGQDWLLLYDLSTESPQLVSSIAVAQAPGEIEIQGDLLLAGTGGAVFQPDSFRLYGLPDLTRLAEFPTPSIWDIETLGDLAFVTNRLDRQLVVFDISDPTAPRAVGSVALPASEGNIAVSEDYLVVGNRRMGLLVFQINR